MGKPSKEEPEEVFEMESVLGYKQQGQRDLYLVKWKGYGESEATWEPRGNLLDPGDDILALMTEFKKSYTSKKRKSTPTGTTPPPPKRAELAAGPHSLQPDGKKPMDIKKAKEAAPTSSEALPSFPAQSSEASQLGAGSTEEPALKAAKPVKPRGRPPKRDSTPKEDTQTSAGEVSTPADSAQAKDPEPRGAQPESHVNAISLTRSASSGPSRPASIGSGPITIPTRASGQIVKHISSNNAGMITIETVATKEKSQITLEKARVQYTQELLDFLLARIRFLPQNRDQQPPAHPEKTRSASVGKREACSIT